MGFWQWLSRLLRWEHPQIESSTRNNSVEEKHPWIVQLDTVLFTLRAAEYGSDTFDPYLSQAIHELEEFRAFFPEIDKMRLEIQKLSLQTPRLILSSIEYDAVWFNFDENTIIYIVSQIYRAIAENTQFSSQFFRNIIEIRFNLIILLQCHKKVLEERAI
jgi:hypothetical protein